LLFSPDLFENVGEPINFNQARLQLVKKKKGATGPNAERLVEEKLYTRKSIILKNRNSWTYRESKILELMKFHPNIITFRGLVEPTLDQLKSD